MRPLSTPFKPVLWPQSAIRIPGHTRPSPSRNWHTKAWTPSFLPLIKSWEKTIAWVACWRNNHKIPYLVHGTSIGTSYWENGINWYIHQLEKCNCFPVTTRHRSGIGTFAAPPIQYFCADSQGVSMMNSSLDASNVVVVSMPRTWPEQSLQALDTCRVVLKEHSNIKRSIPLELKSFKVNVQVSVQCDLSFVYDHPNRLSACTLLPWPSSVIAKQPCTS